MTLSQKLGSITSNQTVAELNQMLNHAQVSISWYGERLVSVNGYSGSVTINEFAQKYLRTNPFKRDTDASLQEGLECYQRDG